MTNAAEVASTSITRILRDAGGATRGTPRGTARIYADTLKHQIKTKRYEHFGNYQESTGRPRVL